MKLQETDEWYGNRDKLAFHLIFLWMKQFDNLLPSQSLYMESSESQMSLDCVMKYHQYMHLNENTYLIIFYLIIFLLDIDRGAPMCTDPWTIYVVK